MTETSSTPPRIAIACQGGGSHTAFTAGVLSTLLRRADAGEFTICALSGTSGGAICATLAWYGLLQQATNGWPVAQTVNLLRDFWHDLTPHLWNEALTNSWTVELSRMQERGLLPDFVTSPYAPPVALLSALGRALSPRRAFVDLGYLLEHYVRFDRVSQQAGQEPRLLVGAVEVLTGTFQAFDSWRGEISTESVLASTRLPTLFPAQEINGAYYWDGLFSQNPPVRDLLAGLELAQKPDQIWIIRINPQTRATLPMTTGDIEDRRNELAGNLSLNQELRCIELVNRWVDAADGLVVDSNKKKITLKSIAMSTAVSDGLDRTSKFDRSRALIERLIADGEAQAAHVE